MDKHNLICKYQFGFRSKHSTQHAVISLVNNITNSLDSSNIVIGVFLDLKKAFDTVDPYNSSKETIFIWDQRQSA